MPSASSTAARRVERLHVTAPDETLSHRALRLLDDAFRTATLPDGGARVVLVRTLALPCFAAGISPQTLSIELERSVAALSRFLVHAEDPAAPHAPAVWFRDALEAHTLLAIRLAERAPASAWFWPLAVPRAASGDVRERLRAVVLALCELREARAALPAFAREIVAHRVVAQVIAALRDSDAAVLARAAGIGLSTISERPRATAPEIASAPRAPTAANPVAAMLEAECGAGASPVVIGAFAAILGGRVSWPAHDAAHTRDAPAGMTNAREPRHADPAEPQLIHPRDIAARSPHAPRAAARVIDEPHVIASDATPSSGSVPRSPAARVQPASRRASASARTAQPPAIESVRAGQDAAHDAPAPEPWPSGAPTGAGGLLFLVPVLERLGYADWLELCPAWAGRAIERRLFAQVCARLRVPQHDPAWLLARYDDARDDPLADALARAWLDACRRRLRRTARIGIATLVARRARLTLTPTHADVDFELQSASTEVRAAGLDLDPGWVPWLGRVVAFHYRSDFERWT